MREGDEQFWRRKGVGAWAAALRLVNRAPWPCELQLEKVKPMEVVNAMNSADLEEEGRGCRGRGLRARQTSAMEAAKRNGRGAGAVAFAVLKAVKVMKCRGRARVPSAAPSAPPLF